MDIKVGLRSKEVLVSLVYLQNATACLFVTSRYTLSPLRRSRTTVSIINNSLGLYVIKRSINDERSSIINDRQ